MLIAAQFRFQQIATQMGTNHIAYGMEMEKIKIRPNKIIKLQILNNICYYIAE